MPVYNFFSRVFGPYDNDRGPGQPGFRNPIWDDEADDDDELDDDFRHSLSSPFGFRIFSGDVMDIHKYFEQQMDDMIKTFQSFSDPLVLPDSDFPQEAPPTKERGPNKFLKPWVDNGGVNNGLKQDTDVDGRITSGDIRKFFPNEDEASASSTSNHLRVHGHSVITRIVKSSDGRLEEEKRVFGSDGREEVSLTRQIGDMKHKVTTKKDSQTGVTDTIEELINLDEEKLDDFNKKWANKLPKPSLSDNADNDGDVNSNPLKQITIHSSPSEIDSIGRLFSRLFGPWFK